MDKNILSIINEQFKDNSHEINAEIIIVIFDFFPKTHLYIAIPLSSSLPSSTPTLSAPTPAFNPYRIILLYIHSHHNSNVIKLSR